MKDIKELEEFLKNASVEEGLKEVARLYPGKVKFSSSLGQEDQVLTDMISRHFIDISIFTLDTGRLFNETYELIEKTEARYKKKIEIYFPQAKALIDASSAAPQTLTWKRPPKRTVPMRFFRAIFNSIYSNQPAIPAEAVKPTAPQRCSIPIIFGR